MRLQTAIEFLIISAAVASFSVTALGIYTHMNSSQRQFVSYAFNHTTSTANMINVAIGGNGSITMSASIPNFTYVNKATQIDIILFGQRSMFLKSLLISDGGEGSLSPKMFGNETIAGIGLLYSEFVPNSTGYANIEINATFATANGVVYRNASLSTYVSPSNGSATAPRSYVYSPSMVAKDEYVAFGASGSNPIYRLSYSSHCSQMNWWYQQLPIEQQCGNAKWYFFISSGYCYYDYGAPTVTYCVYLDPTGANYSQMNQKGSKSYNLTLNLTNGTVRLSSILAQNANRSQLLYGNKSYGTAYVSGAVEGFYPEPYSNELFMNDNSAEKVVNISYYSPYLQQLNNVNAELAYYNNSEVSGSDLSSILQVISGYNTYENAFASAINSTSKYCALSDINRPIYKCRTYSPFEFTNITAVIENYYGTNNSYVVDGSEVYIR